MKTKDNISKLVIHVRDGGVNVSPDEGRSSVFTEWHKLNEHLQKLILEPTGAAKGAVATPAFSFKSDSNTGDSEDPKLSTSGVGTPVFTFEGHNECRNYDGVKLSTSGVTSFKKLEPKKVSTKHDFQPLCTSSTFYSYRCSKCDKRLVVNCDGAFADTIKSATTPCIVV